MVLLVLFNRHRFSVHSNIHGYDPQIKIIHLIYLPWTRDQKLKDDVNDFDHRYYHDLRKKYVPKGWTIKMWTQPLLKAHFPTYWNLAIQHMVRPTQIVDLMRWVVLAEFGGIYMQYDSTIKVDPLEHLLPGRGKHVRLFTETVLSPEQCVENGKKHAVRNGIPEEPVRVMNQAMSSVRPHHPFIVLCRDTIMENMVRYKPKQDYDFLFYGANSLISTLYDRQGRVNDSVELVDEKTTKQWLTVSSRGSWRME
jgi:hypothetical protein